MTRTKSKFECAIWIVTVILSTAIIWINVTIYGHTYTHAMMLCVLSLVKKRLHDKYLICSSFVIWAKIVHFMKRVVCINSGVVVSKNSTQTCGFLVRIILRSRTESIINTQLPNHIDFILFNTQKKRLTVNYSIQATNIEH